MYVKAMEGGLLQKDGMKSTQYMNTQEGVQKWVDTLVGEDKLQVFGYFQGDGDASSKIFNNIQLLIDNEVLVSGGRFDNHHSMMQFYEQGYWRIFDTGRPGRNGPRSYGTIYDEFYKYYNTNSFWILK